MSDRIQIGIDIGAVTIGLAALRDGTLLSKSYAYHHGDIPKTLKGMIRRLGLSQANVGLTGRGTKTLPKEIGRASCRERV